MLASRVVRNGQTRPTMVDRAVVGLLLVGLLSVLLPLSAEAQGPAVVDVAVTPVTAAGDPLTDWGHAALGYENAYRLRVDFSCAVDVCTDTQVTLPASGLDPAWGEFPLLSPQLGAWTAPFDGATISGNRDDGVTVNLGDLEPGQAGSFTLVYGTYWIDTSGYSNRRQSGVFFPPGHQIEMSATIESTNADDPAGADAAPVTWNIDVPAGPSITKSDPGYVEPDTEVTYRIFMASGCLVNAGNHRWADGRLLCAKEFDVTEHLPEQAVFVSAVNAWGDEDGVYDPDTHTVTWETSGPQAAAGWGHVSTYRWLPSHGISYRDVTVIYPADNFPEADGGADFEVDVTNSVTVNMTYLDDSTGPSEFQRTHAVARTSPFGRAAFSAKNVTHHGHDDGVGLNRVPPDTTGEICPESGQDAWGRNCTPGEPVAEFPPNHYRWQHDTHNRANVPGVAIVEDDLDHPGTEVYNITTSPAGAQVEYRLDDGTEGTATSNVDAPEGRYFVWARITSPELEGPNASPSGTETTLFRVQFPYRVPDSAPVGEERTNTISSTMTYPHHPELDDITNESNANQSRTIRFVETPRTLPRFFARFASAPAVEGGGTAVPGRNVTFSVRGATDSIPGTVDITPEYAFVAPEGWVIEEGSAQFPAGSVPPGVTFQYRTVTIDGVDREAVVATWPETVAFGRNATWPTMSVVAQPTYAVTAGTTSVAHVYTGDSRNSWDNTEATYENAFQGVDLNGNGDASEWYASFAQNIPVGASDALAATKEICQPDPDAVDGCNWISDPDIVVGVSPTASDIRYRITLTNTGNTTLDDVVGYDVLPHVGDTGTSEGTASTPRNSTVGLELADVANASDHLSLEFSASTNPCRDEVYSSAPDCDPDWSAPLAGSRSIRMTATEALSPGQSASFEYTAALEAGAPADAVACNSVAVASDRTLPTEPRNVCATTQEADLELTVPERLPLQAGRSGVLPFSVENHGGSQQSPATVTIDLPEDLTITDLEPEGWRCAPDGVHPDGTAVGPDTVTCQAVEVNGTVRSLTIDTPEELLLPVVPDDSLADDEICVPGVVSGPLFDPDLSNNEAEGCFAVHQSTAALGVVKDDGQDAVHPGDVYDYTITVSNLLVGEDVGPVTVVDELPDTLQFVEASHDGVHADAGQPGGTVTWTIDELAAAGEPDADGSTGAGAPGSTTELTLRVEVVGDEPVDVVNTVSVDGPDPADPEQTLCPDGSCADNDVNELQVASVHYRKEADPAAHEIEPGDVVTYTVTVTNDGQVPLTDLTFTDDLSQVVNNATYRGDVAVVDGPGSVQFIAPDQIVWDLNSATLEVDQVAVVTYSVEVDGSITGDGILLNGVVGEGPRSNCAEGSVDPDCSQQSPLPVIESTKTVVAPDDTVPGDEVTYEFTIHNAGQVPGVNLHTIDDLAGVLDDATYNGDAQVSSGPGGVEFDAADQRLVWIGTLQPDETATVTYSVTVDETRSMEDGVLVNALIGSDCPDPAVLDDENSEFLANCVTITPVSAWEATKTVAPAGSVERGDTVTYTVTVENLGGADLAGLTVTDDLSAVLDDASYDDNVSVVEGPGSAELVAPDEIRWQGALPSGASAVITYSVTVNDGGEDPGDGVLTNRISGSPNCPEPACETETLVEAWDVTKSVTPDGPVGPGDTVTYTIAVNNFGGADLTDLSVVDDLSRVLGGATFDLASVSASDGVVDYTQPNLTWQGDLGAGQQAVITYEVTVRDAAELSGRPLVNVLRDVPNCSDDPVTDPASDGFNPACVTVTDVAAWTATKQVQAHGSVAPGDVVGYEITVANTGSVDLTADEVAVVDDLDDVQDDASYNADADSGAVYAEPFLSWSDDLDAGDEMVITYSVTVNDAAELGDGLLTNALSGAPNCPAGCETTTAVEAFTVSKSVAAPDPVAPGSQVEYEVTVTNTGGAALSGASFVDDLSGVLDDASWDGDADATTGDLTYDESALSWQGDLGVGDVAVVTYTVTVDDPIEGDFLLVNALTGGDCPGHDGCVTETPLPGVHYTKRIEAPDGVTELSPGDTFTYHVTVTNSGHVDLADLSFEDDLSDVLDDATYNGDAAANSGHLSYTEPILRWVGDLGVGEVTTVTYTVTIDDPITGSGTLRNGVIGTGPNSNCDDGSADADCWTQFPHAIVEVHKELVGPAAPAAGDVVTWRIVAHNRGGATAAAELIEDDLSGVLDDAVFNDDADATTGEPHYEAPVLAWLVDIDPDETVELTYSVTVNASDDLGDGRLINAVTGGSCQPAGDDRACVTDDAVRAVHYRKSIVEPLEDIEAGDTVTYQVTVSNPGGTPLEGLSFTDDFSEVLGHGTYLDDATADVGTVGYTAPVLTWSGSLDEQEVATVTYSVRLDDDIPSDATPRNVVVGDGPGSNCRANPGDPVTCTVTLAVGADAADQSWAIGRLPFTGGDVLWLLVAALAAAATGAALLLGRRRRHTARPDGPSSS